MRQSGLHRPYDLIMSLGYNCMVAYQLKRLTLRNFSGPIDWVISENTDQLIRLLDRRFHGYMDEPNLTILGTHNGFYSVMDTEYQMYSFHDFPILTEQPMITNYAEFKEKRDRRISNFLSLAAHSQSSLFVRERCTREEAIRLKESLSSMVSGNPQLLIINYTNGSSMVDHDWPDEGICCVSVNLDVPDENLRDSYWNDAFRGVTLIR